MQGAPLLQWVARIRRGPEAFQKDLATAASERRPNSRSAWATIRRLGDLGLTFACAQCSFAAASRQQLAIHSFKVDGLRRPVRGYIDTAYCPIGLQLFYTRERVICHVQEKSHRCRAVILNCFAQLDSRVVKELDATDAAEARDLFKQGRRRHYASKVASRLHGPLCREAYVVGLSHRTLLKTQNAYITAEMISDLCVQHAEQ